jgi:hypothetical protein
MGLKIISEKFRDDVLKLNLKTPPDIVLGLVNLSGSALYAAYIDSLGKDAIIKTDKASVTVKNPGDVINDSITPRQQNLNKNLQTPTDVSVGLGNITANQSLTLQYLSGRGDDTQINDFNVINPGDVVADSVNPRRTNLNRNLQTPPDILANISSGYLSGLGQDTTIGDSVVRNPGTVDDTANIERPKLFGWNKPINVNDPSENDPLFSFLSRGGYTYTSLLQSIGNMTLINDLKIPNAISISTLSNQTAEVSLQLQLQQNRYFPVEINQFESTVLSLKPDPFSKPYIDAYNSGIFIYSASQQYEPSSFLNIRTSINPLSIMTNTADPASFLLNGGTPPLKDETLLMNIAALELKFNFETRIKRAIERETLGRTNLDEALTNPIAAANIIRNPYGWFNLFERNYNISVPSTTLGKAAQFASDLAGLSNPINIEFALSTDDDLAPKCFGNQIEFGEDGTDKNRFEKFLDSLLGRSATRKQDRDAYFLRRTGAGQRYSLFYSVGKNKYQPDYLADGETQLFLGQDELQVLRKIGGYFGIGAGERPEGNFYIGNKGKYDDPFYLLQDADGHQVRSNQAIVEAIKKQNPSKEYEEPGYSGSDIDNGGLGRPQGVSEYGSLKTNFIWKSSIKKDFGLDTAFDFKTNQKSQQINLSNIAEKSYVGTISDNLFSVTKYKADKFRECSILFTTSQLLDKGIQTEIGTFNSPIDQTITKFYDGYDFMSRANATILPKKVERLNRQGEVIGYRYLVPGLDASGKRNDKEMYKEAELCRVWTKPRPYAKITDLVRYKELIRKERNSVIDRFGNYNIFPSELNVNTGYGREGSGFGDAAVEFFNERRARKYMFSIENLAWRDYKATNYFGISELPDCEKGPNGGRVMWFPPYDIQFTDNTTANWTSHQFLGRPEPVYTYNNSERTGSLSWKIVVDHPSILNLLTQKELARLSDGEVDELLSAFWAGCLEFDVFELARIWNQFSQSDIDYFKKIIGDLDLTKSNEILKPKLEKTITYKKTDDDQNLDVNLEKPKSLINNHNLFFENDVPLNPNDFTKNANNPSAIYDTGKIESYDILFNRYLELTKGIDLGKNVETTKNNYRSVDIDPELIKYDYTIGNKSAENYMESPTMDPKWYGMDSQYRLIREDLSNTKYKGFDLKINIEAHASPIAPDRNNTEYNNALSRRRFISVVKWLVTKVMNQGDLGKIYYNDETEVTTESLEKFLKEQHENNNLGTINFKRENGKPNGGKDDITFILTKASGISSTDAIKAILPSAPVAGPDKNIYFIVDAPTPNSTTKVQYCCFETEEIANKAISEKWVPQFPNDNIGTINAKGGRPYKDVVCGALSIVSSYARRVSLNVTVSKKPENPEKTQPIPEDTIIQIPGEQPLTYQNVTKRDIAQRIINKMITECDYFELLKEDTPFLYDSLKQKLKYFQPAFHATTPEGLNSRLTFLQQCLRPGETIKRKLGEDFCDASNTAFGKPPICVLRIGDFYHTKIAIDNLQISYEPLVWDLNPEGIGAQPMIANIQLSFKYIGGSGLRKHVDELQNALSFNYYANADVYDDRTFANKDLFERNLINLERSFFDNNTLDLIPIVSSAERLVPNGFSEDIPYGTIGVITKRRIPTTAGGNYSSDILSAKQYNSSTVYQPYEIVTDSDKFYIRKADNENNLLTQNTLNGSVAPTSNKTYWEEIFWRNYGEQAFSLEFNSVTKNFNNDDQFLDKTYFNWFEVQYMDLFKQMYETYGQIYVDNYKFNTILEPEDILLNLVLNKNYDKKLTVTNSNPISGVTEPINFLLDPLTDMGELPYQDGFFESLNGITSGSTNGKYNLFKTFDEEASERNYVEYGSIGLLTKNISEQLTNSKLSPVKLHLYPQNYMYKIGDGKSVVPNNGTFDESGGRFNPGNFTGGFKLDGSKKEAEVAGFYLKNYTNYSNNIESILRALRDEIIVKTKLDLNHFWALSPNLFKEYNELFETPHKQILRNYLSEKIANYVNDISAEKINLLRDLEFNNAKMGSLINGLSIVLDGYDIKTDETRTYRYEVIPNDYELTTDPKTLFGYEPYFEYKTLSFNNFQIVNFTDVRKIIYDSELNVLSPLNPMSNKLKFLSLGNGTYFFKQISKDNKIKNISGSDYTFDNNLPESIAIKNNVSLSPIFSPNFVVTDGVMLNTKVDKKGVLGGQTTTLSVQPSGSENIKGSYQENYRMKYTFEKLNYEFFDFSNKNLDIMLNDNYIKRDFDMDIIFDENFAFYTQLLEIDENNVVTPLTFSQFLDANSILLTEGEEQIINQQYENYLLSIKNPSVIDLFYNGINKNLKNIPISYYMLNLESVSGTTTAATISEINQFIEYKFVITKEFVENSAKSGLTSVIGSEINMSGLIDLFFIKPLFLLKDSDKNEILKQIKAPGNEPKKGISGNDKTKARQIEQKYKKIESTLNKIFIEIKNYVNQVNTKVLPLHTKYVENEEFVVKNINKILVDNENLVVYDPQFIAERLLKGGVEDYTVTIKDTTEIMTDVINNYITFTNTRGLFNITSQSEDPEVVETTNETEFNKYLKYDVGPRTN